MNGNEEESSWDSLASELGLEPAKKPALPATETKPKESLPAPAAREEFVEVIPARVTEIEMKVTSVSDIDEPVEFGEGIVEDGADVFDDEAPESEKETGEADDSEGEGKGRRRRRRRRRKKGGPEGAVAVTSESAVEEGDENDVLSFPTGDDVEPAEEAAKGSMAESADDFEESQDEVEEIVPELALVEDEEEESTEPLPEWKVTSWTDLIATLYRPQDR